MKQSLLLLHGALGSEKQFESIKEGLSSTFDVYSFDFDGHGNGSSTEEMSIELFAENLYEFVLKNNLQQAFVFGYSMGGYVALYLQSKHPDLFQSITTLGTKFNWSAESAEKEIQMLNPEKIKEKVPAFAEYLKDTHLPSNWERVMEQTKVLMLNLGNKPLLTEETMKKVSIPVVICLGELDKMVSVEESLWAKKCIPNSKFEVINGVPHPIQLIDPSIIIDLIKAQA